MRVFGKSEIRFVIFVCFLSLQNGGISGQPIHEEVFIQNKKTRLLFDIKGGIINSGNDVWAYVLNYSKAQKFYLSKISNADTSFTIEPSNATRGRLYLSLKNILSATNQVFESSNNSNVGLVIDEKYPPLKSSVQANMPTALNPKGQAWKIVPVAGESNTFFIQSALFQEKRVLEPTGGSSPASLRIAAFRGDDSQKWIIMTTYPKSPEVLILSEFNYDQSSQKIKGNLVWEDRSSNEDGFEIFVMSKNTSGSFDEPVSCGKVGANIRTFRIDRNSSPYGKDKEHCFYVKAYNGWGTSISTSVCKTPLVVDNRPGSLSINLAFGCLVSGPASSGTCSKERIQFRLVPLDLTGQSGAENEISGFLYSSNTLPKNLGNNYRCCIASGSSTVPLKTGKWILEFYRVSTWVYYCTIEINPGNNNIFICYDAPLLGCSRQGYPCGGSN